MFKIFIKESSKTYKVAEIVYSEKELLIYCTKRHAKTIIKAYENCKLKDVYITKNGSIRAEYYK